MSKEITRGCHLLDPEWNGLFLIIWLGLIILALGGSIPMRAKTTFLPKPYIYRCSLRFPRMDSMLLEIFRYLRVGLRVLLDVSALLLEPFSREGVGGLRGLSLVVQGSFWGVSSE